MHVPRRFTILVAVFLAFSSDVLAQTLCDEYAGYLRKLSRASSEPLTPVTQGGSAGERRACSVTSRAGRSVTLEFHRSDAPDAQVGSLMKAYSESGLFSAPTPKPTLGNKGFSIAASKQRAGRDTLVVIGHNRVGYAALSIRSGMHGDPAPSAEDVAAAHELVLTVLHQLDSPQAIRKDPHG